MQNGPQISTRDGETENLAAEYAENAVVAFLVCLPGA